MFFVVECRLSNRSRYAHTNKGAIKSPLVILTAHHQTDMSRHRYVRNINIHDELDEDFDHEDDPFEGITPDQQAQLDSATEKVLSILGSDSLVTEPEIRRQLWDSYFDVDATASWALGETA